jgi:hypothetical protein
VYQNVDNALTDVVVVTSTGLRISRASGWQTIPYRDMQSAEIFPPVVESMDKTRVTGVQVEMKSGERVVVPITRGPAERPHVRDAWTFYTFVRDAIYESKRQAAGARGPRFLKRSPISEIPWESIADDLQSAPTMRDLTIVDCDATDPQRVLSWLKGSGYELKLIVDSEPSSGSIPDDVQEMLALRPHDFFLKIDPDELDLHCYFFTGYVDFNLIASSLNSRRRLDRLVDFMERLGRLLGRRVPLTYENGWNPQLTGQPLFYGLILQYNPRTDLVEYFPV